MAASQSTVSLLSLSDSAGTVTHNKPTRIKCKCMYSEIDRCKNNTVRNRKQEKQSHTRY
jgi:hypothetical protein